MINNLAIFIKKNKYPKIEIMIIFSDFDKSKHSLNKFLLHKVVFNKKSKKLINKIYTVNH